VADFLSALSKLLATTSKPKETPSLINGDPSQIANLLRILTTGVDKPGLTGLDPKFFKDPRFDYEAKMGNNPEEVKGAPVVLMGNPQRDDYDSAPVGAKSTLAVDTPWQAIANSMNGKDDGPSDWFSQNARDIMKGAKVATQAMAEEMRRRMLQTRNRIEDRF
jgi:hypothetical protein